MLPVQAAFPGIPKSSRSHVRQVATADPRHVKSGASDRARPSVMTGRRTLWAPCDEVLSPPATYAGESDFFTPMAAGLSCGSAARTAQSVSLGIQKYNLGSASEWSRDALFGFLLVQLTT